MSFAKKQELRTANARAWTGQTDVFTVHDTLDSALKKNTAFIKRLRTGMTASSAATFIADIRSLSLHKYLSEIISACFEGLGKAKTAADIAAAVDVTSALHQRFGAEQFTKQVGWLLMRALAPPDKAHLKALSQDSCEREEKERLARQRILLRVAVELWVVGVLRAVNDVERPDDVTSKGKDAAAPGGAARGRTSTTAGARTGTEITNGETAEAFPFGVLKELLTHDSDLANLPLAVLFAKNYSDEILGITQPPQERKPEDETDVIAKEVGDEEAGQGEALQASSLIPADTKARFRALLTRYTENVKAYVVRSQKKLFTQSRRNAEAYVRSGEIFEDRQSNFEKQAKHHEKLVSQTQTLCEILGLQMPDLQDEEASQTSFAAGVELVKTGEYLRGQGEGPGIWEDEEERRFYENLADMNGKVPSVLLDGNNKKAEDGGSKKKPDAESTEAVEEPAQTNGDVVSPTATTDVPSSSPTAVVSKSIGAQVDAILAKLPELQTKAQVDEVALDFCFVNSKASRNRLIKALQEVPKGRSDLLALYARLVATLGQYFPDISQGIVTYLNSEFRSLQHRKQKTFLGQVRTLNIRYLAELTKFGVVPEHVIFHCFKVSLDDFSQVNIEIIGNLLETCGRYLLRNPETHPRMASFLETLGRKKSAQHLPQQERMILENAMYYVDPPPRPAIQRKERTPLELFVRHLIFVEMNKRNHARLLKLLRKLQWDDADVVDMLIRIFTKPGKIKYGNIHVLAVLTGALYAYHPEFVVNVIDTLMENITFGLEINDFKFNQKRLAEVKFLGELYNHKIVEMPVILDTLYQIATFGHEGGNPTPNHITPFDLPDDFFRARLICAILDTTITLLDRGSGKKKLDFFLKFFQYYLSTKAQPLPMDIEFMLRETFAVARPQWRLVVDDPVEAAGVLQEAIAENYKVRGEPVMAVAEEEEESGEEEEEEQEVVAMGSLSGDDGDEVDDDDHDDEEEVAKEVMKEMEGEERDEDDEKNANEQREEDDDEEDEDEEDDDGNTRAARQGKEPDPEADSDFDRAFERMMVESLESRKYERKAMFDVPLPMRRNAARNRAASPIGGGGGDDNVTGDIEEHDEQHRGDDKNDVAADKVAAKPNKTIPFSLMTKRGNRNQTRTIGLPSDSSFAVALKNQQAAEREEQQKIKNLVLNYDLGMV